MKSIDTALLAQWKRVRLETDRLFGVDFAALPLHPELGTVEPLSAAGAGAGSASASDRLSSFEKEWSPCNACTLWEGRTNLVFGEGSAGAELVFVGEAPGAEEDRQGRPFVGRAGQLLTRIIEAMGFRRDEVYIANVLKCRPPNNRDPSPGEVASCLPALRKQIEIIDPKMIVTLGKHAVAALSELPPGRGITKIRGEVLEFDGRPLMPTFHPAYLLRNPGEKRKVWEDMKRVLKALGRPVPRGKGGVKSP
ncbi:MAG: uracil-DNA glycosylase [Planctomycetota bacterium]|jgi:DNA polymerase